MKNGEIRSESGQKVYRCVPGGGGYIRHSSVHEPSPQARFTGARYAGRRSSRYGDEDIEISPTGSDPHELSMLMDQDLGHKSSVQWLVPYIF